ncbi:MAG: peptidoglycan-binding domain-containing protein [Rhodospirillales bacterium]
MIRPFRLKQTIGETYNMDLEDALNTKHALAQIGHLEPPEAGLDEFPDRPMIEAVKSFQRDQGLAEDGIMKPDGPTLERLNESLTQAQPSAPRTQTSSRSIEPSNPLDRHLSSLPARPGAAPQNPIKKEDLPEGTQVAVAPAIPFLLGLAGRAIAGQAARGTAGAAAAGAAGALMNKAIQEPARDTSKARMDMAPPMPPQPGYEPPDMPLPDRTESLPTAKVNELKETYPVLKEIDVVLEGFPDQRDELIQILILQAGSRGTPPTQDRNNFLLDRYLKKLKSMNIPRGHAGGGTSQESGYQKEHHFKKKDGVGARRSDGRVWVAPTLEDLFWEDIQTVDTLVDGETLTKREDDALQDIKIHKEKDNELGGVTTYPKHSAMPLDEWKEIMGPRVDAYIETNFGRFRKK